MGNRRMISKTITQTHRFLQMPLEVQALYFHLIQNSDDDGIVEAFPIVRMIGASEDSLKLLQAKAFIKPLNDEMIFYIIDFHEQNVIRADRKVNSIHLDLLKKVIPNAEIIEPKQRADRVKKHGHQMDDNGTTNGLPNISKGNIIKDNISKGSRSEIEQSPTTAPIINQDFYDLYQAFEQETGKALSPMQIEDLKYMLEDFKEIEQSPTTAPIINQDFYDLYQAFEQETGKALSPMQIEDLKYMLEDFKSDMIFEALREAVSQGKSNFAYIQAILKRWKQDNLMTVELVRNAKAAREKKKQGTQQVNKSDNFPEMPF